MRGGEGGRERGDLVEMGDVEFYGGDSGSVGVGVNVGGDELVETDLTATDKDHFCSLGEEFGGEGGADARMLRR